MLETTGTGQLVFMLVSYSVSVYFRSYCMSQGKSPCMNWNYKPCCWLDLMEIARCPMLIKTNIIGFQCSFGLMQASWKWVQPFSLCCDFTPWWSLYIKVCKFLAAICFNIPLFDTTFGSTFVQFCSCIIMHFFSHKCGKNFCTITFLLLFEDAP